jgi:hypothetical protein
MRLVVSAFRRLLLSVLRCAARLLERSPIRYRDWAFLFALRLNGLRCLLCFLLASSRAARNEATWASRTCSFHSAISSSARAAARAWSTKLTRGSFKSLLGTLSPHEGNATLFAEKVKMLFSWGSPCAKIKQNNLHEYDSLYSIFGSWCC